MSFPFSTPASLSRVLSLSAGSYVHATELDELSTNFDSLVERVKELERDRKVGNLQGYVGNAGSCAAGAICGPAAGLAVQCASKSCIGKSCAKGGQLCAKGVSELTSGRLNSSRIGNPKNAVRKSRKSRKVRKL